MTEHTVAATDFDPDARIAAVTEADPNARQTYAHVVKSPDCIKILDLEGRIKYMSRNGLCAMEIAHLADVSGQIWWDLWPEEMRATVKASFDGAMLQVNGTFRGRCPTANGTRKDWEVTVRPVLDGEMKLTSILSVSRDVSSSGDPRARWAAIRG